MRMKWLAVLLILAGCADPVAWGRDMTGDWHLNARAGEHCQMSGVLHLSGSADAFTGTADLGFSRSTPGGVVSADGVGFAVSGEYPHLRVLGHDLLVTRDSVAAMGGTWSCDSDAGTWTIHRG